MPRLHRLDEPTMSDRTLLVSVEDLINIAMGPKEKNTINFKLLETVLHILARHMRLLEQKVEINLDQSPPPERASRKHKKTSPPTSPKKASPVTTARLPDIKEEEVKKGKKDRAKAVDKEKRKSDKEAEKEKSAKADAEGETEKGRDAHVRRDRAPGSTKATKSIDVVTRSQFDLLEETVLALKKITGPLPALTLPDNEKLRDDLARGSASLTDTMGAMKVDARVQAAEEVIVRMAQLLTQLAAAGALPQEIVDQVSALATDEQFKKGRKSVGIDAMTTSGISAMTKPSLAGRSFDASIVGSARVTRAEMDDSLAWMKEQLTTNITNLTNKAGSVADSANKAASSVSEKMGKALELNKRLNSIHNLVNDYSEQLSGFGVGLNTQMQSFQEQMAQIRSDLKAGLDQLEQVNNNVETAAIMELKERFDELVLQLNTALHEHEALTSSQGCLDVDLKNLLQAVEMLKEEKADRDEVLDGLRDKADNSRLAGLLTEIDFNTARIKLEMRLDLCHEKFHKQEQVWMDAIKDLLGVTGRKAELIQVLAARDDARRQLQELSDQLKKLAHILGEPKAAILTRQLAKDAVCGACQIPALMDYLDSSHGKPAPLPAMLPHSRSPVTPADEEPCLRSWKPEIPDERTHACHRWVGGSHTLMTSDMVTRERAKELDAVIVPTRKYVGYGDDNRFYMMEEEISPCVECNMPSLKANEEKVNEATEQGQGEGGKSEDRIRIDDSEVHKNKH